ncbi:MAG: hypothetical protein KF812_12455 [Fimbriimonadaceae bacterium]|nr:hypothetical protein [Fimbriimonadaceae bacterium]
MKERVLGVLNGGDLPLSTLEKWANSATNLYAADGATDRLIALGHRPIVVGDGDSGNRDRWPSGLEIRKSTDQETSDTDKLFDSIASDGHRNAVLAGIEGDNPMHTLANLHSVARSPLSVVLRYRRFDGWIVSPDRPWSRPVGEGQKVSLMPLVACHGVEFVGVKWPLHRASLAMAEKISLSNVSEGEVSASLAEGLALLLVRRDPSTEPPWS